jgi:pilus assembly protein Flp/PilA
VTVSAVTVGTTASRAVGTRSRTTFDPKDDTMIKLYTRAQARLNALRTEEDGNAAEYGLIIAIVALGIVVGLGVLAVALNGLFTDVAGNL